MPTCNNCHKKWSWKQTIKRSFTLGGGMTCPYCKEKQYVSASSRKKSSIFALFPIPIVFLNSFIDLSIYFALIIAIVIGFIIFGIYPFLIELSNEEEPLF